MRHYLFYVEHHYPFSNCQLISMHANQVIIILNLIRLWTDFWFSKWKNINEWPKEQIRWVLVIPCPYYSMEFYKITNGFRCCQCMGLVMDRITATATAYNCMLFWQPQPRCGCEYDNRNRGYFFNNREYFKKFLYNKLFYIC